MKASKINPFRQGVTLYVKVKILLLCPVTLILSFMVVRGNRPKPLFIGEDGKYLTREVFVTEVQLALKRAGYPAEEHAGHIFCIAAVQLQKQVGVKFKAL